MICGLLIRSQRTAFTENQRLNEIRQEPQATQQEQVIGCGLALLNVN